MTPLAVTVNETGSAATPRNGEHLEADLGTAAFLVARGFRLLGLVPLTGRRLAFRFDDVDGGAAKAALAYLQGANVTAKAIMDAQRSLKTLLYSTKEGNGNRDGMYNNR